MRRLNEEKGAIGVLAGLMMVVLLGFVALVVDIGMMYSEKAQLQNGADAAALSIAQSCSQEWDGTCTAASSLAKGYADANALDGLSNIQDIDLGERSVTVTTGALEPGGELNSISLVFANALGIPTAEVGAKAGAEWGAPIGGPSPFPLAFSICQVREKNVLQLLQSHGDGANEECNYGPSGQIVPGGFGWVTQETGLCEAFISSAIDATAESDTGNDGPENCNSTLNSWGAKISSGDSVIVLLPVFDGVLSSPTRYDIMGLAAFDIRGWKFSGGDNTLPMSFRNTKTYAGDLECKGDCRGIIGQFVEYVSLEDVYQLGPINEDLGTTIVRLKPLEP